MTTRRGKSCKHKRRYETREAATAALKALIRDKYASPHYMNTYHCRHCGNYHIGHRQGFGARR